MLFGAFCGDEWQISLVGRNEGVNITDDSKTVSSGRRQDFGLAERISPKLPSVEVYPPSELTSEVQVASY